MKPIQGLVLLAVAILVMALTGCGGDHFQVKDEKIGHGYSVVRVPYKGRTIDCIMRTSDTKDGYDVRSISCDFVDFHR